MSPSFSPRASLLAVLSLALLAACDRGTLEPTTSAAPLAAAPSVLSVADPSQDHPNNHGIRERDRWMSRLVTFGCGPLDEGSTELVNIDGTARERRISLTTPDGTLLWHVTLQPTKLRGVGLRTGQEYEVTTKSVDFTMNDAEFIKYLDRESWAMRNLATGEKYSVTFRTWVEMDADREIVYHRDEEKVRCVK